MLVFIIGIFREGYFLVNGIFLLVFVSILDMVV